MQARHPRTLADVDLFAPGAQEHWYAAYAIFHKKAPVQRLPGEGLTPGTDAFVLTKYEGTPWLAQWGNAQVMSYVVGTTHTTILTPEQSADKFRLLAGITLECIDPVEGAGGGLPHTSDRALPDDASENAKIAQERFPLSIPAWWGARA